MGAQYTSNLTGTKMAEAAVNGTMMGDHLRDWDDVKGMPYFPAGTNSLLAKCLTKEIWDSCHDKRDKFGFSFK